MDLVIAEKHNAAKRIAEILGNPKQVNKGRVRCYELQDKAIVPLRGHIKNPDFPKKYSSWNRTDLNELVKAPIKYQETRKSIGNAIRHYAKKADTLQIATDYDREGESIGKESIEIAKEKRPDIPIQRARFSSLTNEDVSKAFDNLKEFEWNLANSADARREIDLIWGAVLTRYLSLTANRLGKSYLSAGRVQTPTLSIMVDREKHRKQFKPKTYWKLWIKCRKNNETFKARYKKKKVFDKNKANELKNLKGNQAQVTQVNTRKYSRKPPTPFNTTSFLRQASSIGFSPSSALSIAESLYQDGLISYPRTDNTQYPDSLDIEKILGQIKQIEQYEDYTNNLLNKGKLKPTKGKKKSTDHPPIHPVKKPSKKLNKSEWKIYKLITERFLATLSEKSLIQSIKAKLNFQEHQYQARGRRILKQGWQEIYPYKKTKEKHIPKLKKEETVKVDEVNSNKKKTKPKPRYSASKIIKKMEDQQLGTKSTRPAILDKLVSRGYVAKKKKYKPLGLAFAVINNLEEYAPEITKPEMTSKLEKEMEKIQKGKKTKDTVVNDSRKMLGEVLEELQENKKQVGKKIKEALKETETIDKCPECNGELVIRRSRKGSRFIGCSGYPKCKKTYPLPRKGHIESLGEQCEECGAPMIKVIRNKGRDYEMCLNPDCKTKEDW